MKPFSKINVIKNGVKAFNFDISEEQKKTIIEVLRPVDFILYQNSKNCIFILKDGDLFQAEALIYTSDEPIKVQSVGINLKATLDQLIGKMKSIHKINMPIISERAYQFVG